MKDLKWLNLTHCKFGTEGLSELFSSKNLRSLEVLIAKDNKIKDVLGPFDDLREATDKQLKKSLMHLQFLDLRRNKLTSIHLKKAQAFLRETVVLLWQNAFEDFNEKNKEFHDPSSLFKADEEIHNPMHLYTAPYDNQKSKLSKYLKEEFEKEFRFEIGRAHV